MDKILSFNRTYLYNAYFLSPPHPLKKKRKTEKHSNKISWSQETTSKHGKSYELTNEIITLNCQDSHVLSS